MALFASKAKKYQSPNHLSSLIQAKEWKKVRKYFAARKSIKEPSGSDSPLILVSKANPPFSIIEMILNKNPKAAYEIDYDGKSALHLACEYGASPAVIRKILHANTAAASKVDVNGMLPIHLACRSYCINNDSWISKEAVRGSLKQVLDDLLKVEPTSILTEDSSDMCPVEHALESGLNMDIVEILLDNQMSERSR